MGKVGTNKKDITSIYICKAHGSFRKCLTFEYVQRIVFDTLRFIYNSIIVIVLIYIN